MEPTRDRFHEIDRVFDAALDVAPAEREAFLAKVCGSDSSLLERVRTLLAAHDRSSGFLESNATKLAAELLEDRQRPP